MALPYEDTSSGKNAIQEIQKILIRFGAKSFGVMDNFEKGTVLVQFEWRDRKVNLEASIKGYATAWLKEHPYSNRTDWIKGQITAIEVGMLSFDGAFLGQILLSNGKTILQHSQEQKLLGISTENDFEK
jgi:hypothetical protein